MVEVGRERWGGCGEGATGKGSGGERKGEGGCAGEESKFFLIIFQLCFASR